MSAYYNEIDPYAAQWLRNLIAGGHIAPGEVDVRDIRQVLPEDVSGFTQCHFFAGIGGWSLALRLAGWPDDRPVWTGSCPCQPFSAAGKGKASGDERHLWPHWFELIRACRPPIIFGEQVEAAIGWGWLDLVYSDLEAEGYAVGAAVLPACGVGAPHIRQRLWFVADASLDGQPQRQERRGRSEGDGTPRGTERTTSCGASIGELADTPHNGQSRQQGTRTGRAGASYDSGMVNPESEQMGVPRRARESRSTPWNNLLWLPCTDGKQRPTQSDIFPLAHGVPARVAKLRAAGNAIVPQVAAEFIMASMT
jgi:DNA (cytosine-5)-methyltransferase 1